MSEEVSLVCRNPETGCLETRLCAYEGPVAPKVWERFNKMFLEKAARGYFFPLDPLDAYDDVWLKLNGKADRLPEMTQDEMEPYLCGVARLMFLNWFKRRVEPARKTYRQIEDRYYGKKGAVGEDGFDIDNYDGTADAPSVRMVAATDRGEEKRLVEPADFSARAQAERLCGASALVSSLMVLDRETVKRIPLPDPDQKWKDALETLLDALGGEAQEIVRVFRAYVAANGNFLVAAFLAGIPKATFYRKWPAWIAAARKVGERTAL